MNADEELAFQTWILTGNAVNEVLRGLADSNTELRAKVTALNETLRDVPAERILQSIAELSASDRDLLIAVCERCLDIFGEDSEARVGMSRKEAEPVLARLRSA